MIEIVNLEKLDSDGKKIPANNPNYLTPSLYTYAQLRYNDFSESSAVQGTFISGYPNTVEFDLSEVSFAYILFKLYLSTDGINYTDTVTYGGISGKEISRGNKRIGFYFNRNEVASIKELYNPEGFSYSLSKNLSTEEGYTMTFAEDFFPVNLGGVDMTKTIIRYHNKFCDNNNVFSINDRPVYFFASTYTLGTETELKRKLVLSFMYDDGLIIESVDMFTVIYPDSLLIEIEILP